MSPEELKRLEAQRRLNALFAQSKPNAVPKQSFFNKVRDQFDANTASDQYRRQRAGDNTNYAQQQKDRGIGRIANNPWERTLNIGKSIGESVYATPKRLGQAVEEVVNGNKTQQSFNQLNQTNQKVLSKVNARLANPNLTPAERNIQEDIRQKMIRLQRQGFDEQRKEFSVAADKLDPKKNAAAVADAALTIASAGVAGVAMKTAGQTAAKLGYRAAARQAAPAFFKNMGLNTAQGVTDTVANIGEGRQASWKDIAKGGAVGATVGSVADVGLGLIPGVIGKRQYDKLLKDLASETDAGKVKQTVAAVNKNLPDEAVDNLSNDIAKAGTPDEVNKLLNEAADAEASVATKAVENTVDNPTAPKPETPAIPNTAVTPEIVQGFKQAKTPQQARDAVKALFPELDETTANKVIQDISKARDDKTITQILEQAQARRTAVTRGVQDVTPQAEAIAPTPEQQIAQVAQEQPQAQLTSKQAPDADIQANQVTQKVDEAGTPVSAVQDAVDPLESLKQEATPNILEQRKQAERAYKEYQKLVQKYQGKPKAAEKLSASEKASIDKLANEYKDTFTKYYKENGGFETGTGYLKLTDDKGVDLYNQSQKPSLLRNEIGAVGKNVDPIETPLAKSNRLHEEKLARNNLTQNEYAGLHNKVDELDRRASELHRRVGEATDKALKEANGQPLTPKVRKELRAMADEWGKALDDHVAALNVVRKIDGEKPIRTSRTTQPQAVGKNVDPQNAPIKPKEVKTRTIKTADGKTEYVAQLGDTTTDRVGRATGFKPTDTSPNFKSEGEMNKWIDQNIEKQNLGSKLDPLESLKQEARKYKSADEFVKNTDHTPQTTRVYIKSKFRDGGGYADVPVIREEKNITLYQGGTGENRQFWTPNKEYAKKFGNGEVVKKTGNFYQIDNGNRMTDVYVDADKQLTDLYNQATKAPVEGKVGQVVAPANQLNVPDAEVVNPEAPDFLQVSKGELPPATATSLTPEDLAAIQPKERINPTDATSQAPVRSLKEKPAKQTFEQVTKEYLGDTGAARIERQGTIADLQKRYKLSNDEKVNAILAIDNPSVKPSSPQVAQFVEEYKQLTDSAYKAYTDSGIKMGYVDSYIPRIYKNKETGQLIDRVDYELLQQGTSRVKGREAEDVAVDWLVEKDPTKLLERYYDSMDRTVAGKAYLGKLQDNGLVVASSTSVPGLRPIVAEGLQAGDGMVYYAQKDVANKLNELFGSKEANNIVEAALDKAKGVNSLFQSVVLSGGIPNTPLNAFGVMQVLKEAMALHPVKAGKAMVAGMSKEFSDRLFTDKKDILKLMAQNDLDVRIDLTQTGLRGRTRTKNAFKDQGVTGGINQAWNEFTNDATFGRFMPTLEVLHFENIYKAARKRGASIADASALAAESTKNFYGKTSVYKQAVRSKAVDDAAGAFLFAPRFRESMLNFWAKNAKAVAPQNWGKVAYRDNQKFLVASALTFAAMTQVNEALNGVQMWDNPDGKKDKLIIPADALDKLGINTNGKDVAIPFLPSLATVPRNIGMGAYNFATGKDEEGWKNVKSFTSMPISLGMDIATNEDYFGNKIVEDGASPIQRRVQQSAYIAKNAMQPWVREGLNVAGQKLPENTKAKLGIKEKSSVEATSNALELPFRFYNPKYYNYDKQFVPGGKEGEKFNFAEQRDRAKIGGEIKKIADDLDLNKRQRAAYDKLNAVEFNDDGTLKEDSNPFYKVQRYSDLQDDKVFEAIKKRSELNAKLNGKPIDPIFDESVTPEQRRVLLWKKTLPPGTSDPTVKKLYEQDWYHDYQNKEDAYYDQKTAWNKQMGYKEPAQSTNPYPKATPELQSAMDYYFTLPKGTGARSNWIKGNGGLWNQMIGYWESKDAWTNGERSKVGLGNVDDENTDGSGSGGKFGYNKGGSSGKSKKEDTPKTYIGQLLGDVPAISSNEISIKTTPKRAKLKVKTPSGKGRNYKKIKLG